MLRSVCGRVGIGAALSSEFLPCSLSISHRTFRSTHPVQFRSKLVKICRQNNAEQAINVYTQLLDNKERITTMEYNSLLQCLSRNHRDDKIVQVFADLKRNCTPNEKSYLIMMNYLTSNKYYQESIRLFETLIENKLEPDLPLYTTMITNFFGIEDHESAFKTFEQLKGSHSPPDEMAYQEVIQGSSLLNLHDKALHYLNEMIDTGFNPSIICFNRVIRGLSFAERFDNAFQVFQLMRTCNVSPEANTFGFITNRYAATGQFENIISVIKLMKKFEIKPDVEYLTNYILECYMKKKYDVVIQLYQESRTAEVDIPDRFYTPVLCSCDKTQDFDSLWTAYQDLKKQGHQPQTDGFFAVVFSCCQFGDIKHIKTLFDDMKMFNYTIKSVKQWNSLLKKASQPDTEGNLHPDTAFELYYEMLENVKGLDELPFIHMLRLCYSDSKLNSEVSHILTDMKKKGVTPSRKFQSLLNNLARYGPKQPANRPKQTAKKE